MKYMLYMLKLQYYRSPVNTSSKGNFFSKLWPSKKISTASDFRCSQSWDSGTTSVVDILPASKHSKHVVDDAEDSLPSPPPLPTFEYLVGKRPANLRGKGRVSREHIKNQDDIFLDGDKEHSSDLDSDHSSVSSTQGERKQQKKRAKKKRRSSQEDDAFDWQYNKLTVPQSSPPRERKGLTRKLTPQPPEASLHGQNSYKLELSMSSDSPSSLPTLDFPLQQLPTDSPNCFSGVILDTGSLMQQNNMSGSPNHQNNLAINHDMPLRKTAPISLTESNQKTAPKQKRAEIIESHQQCPRAFMVDINQAKKASSSNPPHIKRQLLSPGGHYPSPIADIGAQVLLQLHLHYSLMINHTGWQ